MVDQLIRMGKGQLGPLLKEKENMDDQQVNDTFDVAGTSFRKTLTDQASGGNISQMMSLFNGDKSHSSQMGNSFMRNLVPMLSTKLGFSENKSNSIATTIVPFFVEKFSSSDTGTAKDEKSFLSKFGLGGDVLSGVGSKLGGLFGK
ncbi:MAG: hypothetical protein ACK40G_09165 [Cytophagaceae bacterium]